MVKILITFPHKMYPTMIVSVFTDSCNKMTERMDVDSPGKAFS
jgi:hypothetical protein